MTGEVTYDQYLSGLHRLGARPTCHLMVHASLSAFGRVEDGAATVIAALATAAGAQGAVIAPSFRDAIRAEYYGMRECSTICPRNVCPSRERGFTGIVGETIRRFPNSVRSCHPTHSWVGLGGGAGYLLDGHFRSQTPCGQDSPFLRLIECDGVVLLLGVGIESLTNIHSVEDVRNVAYLSAVDPPRRHATYTTSGRRIQYVYPHLLEQSLRECRLIRTAKIGAARCHAIRARELGAFLWLITDDDPWCLVLRPRDDRYDPEIDATLKTRRMTEVWRNRLDGLAWQHLLRASTNDVVPVPFSPDARPRTDCPAYRGVDRSSHRCAANDLPPWEKLEDYPSDAPGVATCSTCNWPTSSVASHGMPKTKGAAPND